jgi:Protein of unknown function (DUF3073)
MSAGYAESGSAPWARRRHQGRKAGTVVPVRMLADVALPVAGRRRRRMMHTASKAEIMGPDWLRTFEGVEPMGRGRAKAKQVKVARQLKYKSDDTDLDRLRAELGVGADSRNGNSAGAHDDDEDDDEDPGSDPAEDAW